MFSTKRTFLVSTPFPFSEHFHFGRLEEISVFYAVPPPLTFLLKTLHCSYVNCTEFHKHERSFMIMVLATFCLKVAKQTFYKLFYFPRYFLSLKKFLTWFLNDFFIRNRLSFLMITAGIEVNHSLKSLNIRSETWRRSLKLRKKYPWRRNVANCKLRNYAKFFKTVTLWNVMQLSLISSYV